MSNEIEAPRKWRKRLTRWTITSLLMGSSFAVGVAVTSVIAAKLLFPIAATGMTTGMTMGLVGMVQASSAATLNALYSGDSEMRLTVLTQLKQSFDAQPTQKFDTAAAAWILPAVEHCKTDKDPAVVALADELVEFINDNTLPPPQ
ncbi:hypothetical protein OAG76_01420 [Rubripirellula sp.]|nr:hypothetical protein [Rubripirellula sp.]MDB4634042.1 hypothetical protein [Rubripirellula sp.]